MNRRTAVTKIFLAGATGMLGSKIAQDLRRHGALVRALVRPETGRGDTARALASQGVEIVEGSVLDPVERLARAVEGTEVIISAVQGGDEVVTQGQVNLLRAAEQAGVPRMIPSDFAIDLFRLDYGDNVFLDHRKKADEAFGGSPVRATSVLVGAFLEVMTAPFIEMIDWDRGTFSYWGDGDQPCDFTTVADTAAYTAAVALDPGTAGRPVRVAGDVLTMKEFHAAVERGSGHRLEHRNLGGVDDLAAEIQRRKGVSASPAGYVALQYVWAMVSGKAKLDPLDNARYPGIRPTAVAEFARQYAR
jgi:nucleoside-diphosphate-sugar epimerase